MTKKRVSPLSLNVETRRNLYQVSRHLDKDVKRTLSVFLVGVYAYLQDPLIAKKNPELGIRPIEVKWEPVLGDGPASARFVVVDYNADTGVLVEPAHWNCRKHRFEEPGGKALSVETCESLQFHQVNVWSIAQSVLDIYEDPQALGRAIPWSFGTNRLMLVPHAGYDENAYYDRHSKSLQFYYFGDEKKPKYTCLSHDIIAHEMGHAILDGIRPHYHSYSSLQTGAFHESIADLTAIVAAILNNETRGSVGEATNGDLTRDNAIAMLAEEFGEEVLSKSSLRNANNDLKMGEIPLCTTPHHCSQILTGAMFEVLAGIANVYLQRKHSEGKKTTPKQALWWAADRFRRMAFQPLDYCPPVDIQFADYARAVLTNFLLHEPFDSPRRDLYYDMMREIFDKRGILGRDEDALLEQPRPLIFHDINRISRSRTAAYYFLHDNRQQLHIPLKADLEIADLYDTEKYGRNAIRLPREIVLQYIWREEVPLAGERFGRVKDRRAELLCGGTLVFDSGGNILAWAPKHGGKERQEALRDHIAGQAGLGLRGEDVAAEVPGPWTPAVIGDRQNGLLRLEIAPHLRSPLPVLEEDSDAVRSEYRWTSNF